MSKDDQENFIKRIQGSVVSSSDKEIIIGAGVEKSLAKDKQIKLENFIVKLTETEKNNFLTQLSQGNRNVAALLNRILNALAAKESLKQISKPNSRYDKALKKLHKIYSLAQHQNNMKKFKAKLSNIKQSYSRCSV